MSTKHGPTSFRELEKQPMFHDDKHEMVLRRKLFRHLFYAGSVLLLAIGIAPKATAEGTVIAASDDATRGTHVSADTAEHVLWYRQPAEKWTEALPLGNGRLGAMVFGSAPTEHLQLNEGSLWAGQPLDVYPEGFAENFRKVQQLVLDGKIPEAHRLGMETLTKSPTAFRSYEPLADLWIDLQHAEPVTDYRRQLDLRTGIVHVQYRVGEVSWQREVLISAVDDVIGIRISTDTPGAISGTVRLTREKDAKVTAVGSDRLRLDGQIVDIPKSAGGSDDNPGGSGPGGEHMKFAARLWVQCQGGSARTEQKSLWIQRADEVVLLLTAATSYDLDKLSFDHSIDSGARADAILIEAAKKSWEQLVRDHVHEHRSLMDRVRLDLGSTGHEALPTDQRLQAFKQGQEDPGLVTLYFQYGRYLLMSSSRRPGRLPGGLQGIWSDKMWAAWEADYHLNINLQMNYWPADLCNLSETMEPLADWLVRMTANGQRSARALYNADGWVCFHCTNPFGRTTPVGSTLGSQFENGVLDPLAGAWMAMTLWRHYEFTQDERFLRRRAYPVLKGAAQFMLDTMAEDRDGFLVVVPSTSPENRYIDPVTNRAVRITRGSTYHTTLVHVVFEAVIQGATVLDVDAELREQLKTALAKVPPLRIGENGTIQEWIEDYQEQDPHHRHVSHLLGLHPFSLITSDDTELFAAAHKTLQRRGSGGDVGWSNAWKTNFYARLVDHEQAYSYLRRLIGRNAFPNLMDALWPGRLFQIEGNLGGTAGIAEMLLQSHGGTIRLLPALPAAWPDGSVKGLCARGGFEVDMVWRAGRLTSARIHSMAGRPCRITNGEVTIELPTRAGQIVQLSGDLMVLQ
jgi:alpha-L-fucosidase 2